METRLARELDSMLIKSYVNLDCNQPYSSKVKTLFKRVLHYHKCDSKKQAELFAENYPSRLIIQWIDFLRYLLSVGTSMFTLSRILPESATGLILLNLVKASVNVHGLIRYY